MRFIYLFLGLILLSSCARQGRPSGGPVDETPPKFLSSVPDTLSTQVPIDIKEIRINFDEYLILKDYMKNIVVSPPFEIAPTFSPIGSPDKHVKIKFNEPLKPNTTYNINFGNAIQDNNEGNILPYFQYVFSTGDFIDSLEIKGKASVQFLRKQPENIVVGLYKADEEYSDSLILKQKPLYISKAESDGSFKLNYLAEGNYRIIAFDDEISNMQYDFGKEKFGFADEIFNLNQDKEINISLYDQLPNYRAEKAEQQDYGHIIFRFIGQPEEVSVKSLDFDFTTSKTSYIPKSDSLNFWFNPSVDSIQERNKRLRFLVLNGEKSDTISMVYDNTKLHFSKLEIKNKLDYAPGRNIQMVSNYPLTQVDSDYIKVMQDSIQIPVRVIRNTKNENAFSVNFPIEMSSSYEMEFLPDAITDIYGKTTDTLRFKVKTGDRKDYGNLKLTLEGQPKHPFWLELLNEKDEVLEERYGTDSVFEFNYLLAGKYYFRIKVDENENGFWDTGDFLTGKQPENAYIYPDIISVRPLWDMEELWILSPDNDTAEINKE